MGPVSQGRRKRPVAPSSTRRPRRPGDTWQAASVHILAGLAAVALLAWCYLLAAHGGFWRTDQRLPPAAAVPGSAPGPWPSVVAVVPARNEAEVLPATLPTLLGQDYPGEFRVVLVDDASEDGTGEVARRLAGTAERRPAVVRGSDPPPGWTGKLWALGRGLAAPGGSDYLLFTDADIAHAPGTLAALVRAAEDDRRDLVSQMALLRAETAAERALIPAFVYFFAKLYPFRRVNRPGARTAAAAGGCVLVRRRALEAAGGLDRIRGALIDDVALGRLIKRAGGRRTWLGLSTSVVSRRAYPRLADVWGMVARSAYTQLGHSPALLAGTVVGLLLLYAVPPVASAAGLVGVALGAVGADGAAVWSAGLGLAAWGIMSATYVPMLLLYRLSPARAPTLPAVAVLYLAMTVDSARRHRRGRGGAWKGRTLVSPR
ncbi:MAG: glycosyltransferase [Streptosporangiales bacterium]|nr:glycosyltransferase [Streptosporangiales bacterium]